MRNFNVWDIFGKKIVGILKLTHDQIELLFEDGSKLVINGNHANGINLDYLKGV